MYYSQYQKQKFNEQPIWIIYLIEDLTVNKMYIGQTNHWRRRAGEHGLHIPDCGIELPTPKYGTNKYIQMAHEEGHEFQFTWLEAGLTRADANTAEIYWIQRFKDMGYELYNLTCGGSVYDKDPSIKHIDISHYNKRNPLPLNIVQQLLLDEHQMDLVKELEVDEPNVVQLTLYKQYHRG